MLLLLLLLMLLMLSRAQSVSERTPRRVIQYTGTRLRATPSPLRDYWLADAK